MSGGAFGAARCYIQYCLSCCILALSCASCSLIHHLLSGQQIADPETSCLPKLWLSARLPSDRYDARKIQNAPSLHQVYRCPVDDEHHAKNSCLMTQHQRLLTSTGFTGLFSSSPDLFFIRASVSSTSVTSCSREAIQSVSFCFSINAERAKSCYLYAAQVLLFCRSACLRAGLSSIRRDNCFLFCQRTR